MDERYSRQIILEEIGKEGQEKISNKKILIIGAGALGNITANLLVRAGVSVTIVDRDIIELNNLQRQTLFNEEDVGKAKARILYEKLKQINSEVEISYAIEDINKQNIEEFIKKHDLIIDATDNMETRFLINDACIKHKKPWIYGGVIGTFGMTMNIVPNETACLRCLINSPPKIGELPTCDVMGILNTIPAIIGGFQATEAIKILTGKDYSKNLLVCDAWRRSFELVEVNKMENCTCCGMKKFEFLEGEEKESIKLCGRNAIQIIPPNKKLVNFEKLGKRLKTLGNVKWDDVMLQFEGEGLKIILFRDGRAIIYGTEDIKRANSIYAKYIGL